MGFNEKTENAFDNINEIKSNINKLVVAIGDIDEINSKIDKIVAALCKLDKTIC